MLNAYGRAVQAAWLPPFCTHGAHSNTASHTQPRGQALGPGVYEPDVRLALKNLDLQVESKKLEVRQVELAIQHARAEGTRLESNLVQLRHRLSDPAARAAEQELRVEEQRLRLRIAELEPGKLKRESPPPPISVSAVNAANDSRLQPTDGRYRAVV